MEDRGKLLAAAGQLRHKGKVAEAREAAHTHVVAIAFGSISA